jgi:hypothetical protein
MEEKLSKLGRFSPYVYINDAAKGQKPFESYAGGAHVARLEAIQVRYDPDGFVRDYLQHGFELASTDDSTHHAEL